MFKFLAGVFVGAASLALTAFVMDELDQEIKVGDKVQWTVNGSHQFATPKKVEKIEYADDGTAYLFVEDTKTGIPAHQAIKI
jgi:plastocyanin